MERIVTDRAGRTLALRRVGVLETLRLYKALGPELSVNEAYMGLATIAASVAVLDGVPMPFPNGEAGVEVLLERLGEDGTAAVAAAIAPPPLQSVIDNAGNSAGTLD
jgi:hypothetical protein